MKWNIIPCRVFDNGPSLRSARIRELGMPSSIQREEQALLIYLRLLAEHAEKALERERSYGQLSSESVETRRQALASKRTSKFEPYNPLVSEGWATRTPD